MAQWHREPEYIFSIAVMYIPRLTADLELAGDRDDAEYNLPDKKDNQKIFPSHQTVCSWAWLWQ